MNRLEPAQRFRAMTALVNAVGDPEQLIVVPFEAVRDDDIKVPVPPCAVPSAVIGRRIFYDHFAYSPEETSPEVVALMVVDETPPAPPVPTAALVDIKRCGRLLQTETG